MPTNWKSLVENKNAETYVLPDGWTSRYDVAEKLECTEDKVDELLRPGLKSGEFVKQPWPVWDRKLGRKTMVIAYKHEPLEEKAAPFDLTKALELKASGKSYAEIGAEVGMTGDAVRAKLRKVS